MVWEVVAEAMLVSDESEKVAAAAAAAAVVVVVAAAAAAVAAAAAGILVLQPTEPRLGVALASVAALEDEKLRLV